MIIVRTALGQRNHLASDMKSKRTYCGLEFSAGFDETEELEEITPYARDRYVRLPENLCQNCHGRLFRKENRFT